jgi:hypothetical protein
MDPATQEERLWAAVEASDPREYRLLREQEGHVMKRR